MFKKYSKIISIIIIGVMILSIAGCGQKENNDNESDKKPDKQNIQNKDLEDNDKEDEETAEDQIIDEIEKEKQDQNTAQSNPTQKNTQSDSTQKNTQQSAKSAQPSAKNEAAFTIEGPGVENSISFTVSDLKGMSEAMVSDSYFSLGRGAVEENINFKGVSLWYLLNKVGIQGNASKVTVKADDGYTRVFTLAEVKKDDYISQNDPSKRYKMIIAFSQDGKDYKPADGSPFRLVVGQVEEMDFNKQKWIRYVKTIRVE